MSKNNSNLLKARVAPRDEFYTQIVDVERELQHYGQHLRGKTVYCNCDHPDRSAFVEFFRRNFCELGLERLLATFWNGAKLEPTLFDRASEVEDAFVFDLTAGGCEVSPLEGSGDFRSRECVELLGEADVVVTNPPFSLFRPFMRLLVGSGKGFLVMGDQNAVTYNETFGMLRSGVVWLGVNNGGTKLFRVPESYHEAAVTRIKTVGGVRFAEMGKVVWYTNLEHGQRELLELTAKFSPESYPRYDDYDAVNVDRVADIPGDYDGVMGVPITFLYRHNPDQFVLLGDASPRIDGRALYRRLLIRKK